MDRLEFGGSSIRSAETVNQELASLYRKHWTELAGVLRLHRERANLQAPHLIQVDAGYLTARRRLMVVGQMTARWDWSEEYPERMADPVPIGMDAYSAFMNGPRGASPFWQAYARLLGAAAFDAQPSAGLWCNLVPVEQRGGRYDPAIEDALCAAFPVLVETVRICALDALLFLTGPAFDERLRKTLPGAELDAIPVEHEPWAHALPSGAVGRLCARVVHPQVPSATFRTYHPKWLQMHKVMRSVLDRIIEECRPIWGD